MIEKSIGSWRGFGASVRGANHKRANLPNQDAWKLGRPSATNGALVAAVADGHGSPKACRSELGARFAVEVAVDALTQFVDAFADQALPHVRTGMDRLPVEIVREWRRRVMLHYPWNQLLDEEYARVKETMGESVADSLRAVDGIYAAYGTTLLVCAVTDRYILYLQIGDGDILAATPQTVEVFRPIPVDEGLIANATTSLSMAPDRVLSSFRKHFQVVQDYPPELVVLATDGYSNSFSTTEGFQRVATDFLGMLGSEGQESVERQLTEWLDAASEAGSGDDVTVAVLWNCKSHAEPRS